ncbi:MAG TPA: multidrug ABC transporter ATP-binding protein [Candidatus Latescibacteria bacterium]|nr:multidrug ABC transporter ATP-binding protein [Candidatus Latescibacterota bacterium]|tara:strand:- start:2145 stop:3038 length:894 start_codon:yes stop_codon:yes gene_type:complete
MRIQITELTKAYRKGSQPALSDLNLEITHGTFGLLGPNGAGKTTLIKILSTQMTPTAGKVTIDGWDLQEHRAEVRSRLGYLPQHFGAYPKLTAIEFLDYVARLSGLHESRERLERVTGSLDSVGLYDDRNRRTGTFSGGMMRRLGIAQAILADPEFLIVDEPTVGLDPEERIRFRSILGRLSRDRAILISTHIVGDISSTCEDIAILETGKLIYHGPPETLVSRANGKTWRVEVNDRAFEELSSQFHVVTVSVDGDHMDLRMVGDERPPDEAEAVSPNLEDAYVYFMGSNDEKQAIS